MTSCRCILAQNYEIQLNNSLQSYGCLVNANTLGTTIDKYTPEYLFRFQNVQGKYCEISSFRFSKGD